MTTVEDVTFFLNELSVDWPLARTWSTNDIIKKSIAITYDEWLIELAKLDEDYEPTLEEHIIYYLETRDETFFKAKEPTE